MIGTASYYRQPNARASRYNFNSFELEYYTHFMSLLSKFDDGNPQMHNSTGVMIDIIEDSLKDARELRDRDEDMKTSGRML
jgi:hypothetical protein